MKIIYFSQFYPPESIAAAFRAAENSSEWVKAGHQVAVFTGYPNYPTGKVFDGYTVRLLEKNYDGDVYVFRSKLIAKDNHSFYKRLINAGSFFFFGLVNILFHRKRIGKNYDVVLGSSGTIFTALLAWLYAVLIHSPFVFEIRDITYRQMIATGKKNSSMSVKAMKWLEWFLCRRAKQVVVVTEGFRQMLTDEGIPRQKISVVTNGVDISLENPKKDVDDKLVLSYFGTLGISQNIKDTFDYAKAICQQVDGAQYLIIGEGAQRESIEQGVKTGQYPFVELMHGMPQQELESFYEKTELSVVTLRKSPDFKFTLPSKLFQIMGRGIAVLFIGPEGEATDIIRKYDAGLTLCGTVDEDMAKLKEFFSKPDWKQQLHKKGENGAQAVREHYSRKKLAREYADILESLIS